MNKSVQYFKNLWKSFQFALSSSNIKRKLRRIKTHNREKNLTKTIRLAVVGTPSSGKSFLLRDLMDALASMGGSVHLLERDGFSYEEFSHFSPNQAGSGGQTPLYACRRSDHYGQTILQGRKEYDFDFLNIPGEIFKEEQDIQYYLALRRALNVNKNLFVVSTYATDSSDEERLILEPKYNSLVTDNDRNSTSSNNLNKERFREWNDIFGDLCEKGFKLREGSQRSVRGKQMLRHFFEYDTDSVIRSISDLIETRQISVPFDEPYFNNTKLDRAFVFFQYCSLATDIVLCDRIFVKVDDNQKEIDFGRLAFNLSSFLDSKKVKMPNVYLAFRNVDFLLKAKEAAYKALYEKLSDLSYERSRNIIYSIFNYAMLHYVFKYTIPVEEFNNKMGIPMDYNLELVPGKTAGTEAPEDIENTYVDLSGGGGIIHNAIDLKTHITSRIGGQGQAFRRLLGQTGWLQRRNQSIIPHVYFTCTPITEVFDIYENRIIKETKDAEGNVIKIEDITGSENVRQGTNSYEFYRGEGLNNTYSAQSSCACFGSYQLLMDIMIQHDIYDKFEDGQLLRLLRDKKNL